MGLLDPPALTKAAADARYDLAYEKQAYWHDFTVEAPGAVPNPPSGQTYNLTGAGTPVIATNGGTNRLVASATGNAYAGFALTARPTRIGVQARFVNAVGAPANALATVTNKALTSNVATLTTAAAHGFTVGSSVTVAAVDATFNGTFTVTAVPTTTTFSYALTAANVTSATATGTATVLSGTPVAMVFGNGTQVTDLITESAHIIVQRDSWTFQYRTANTTVTVRSGYFAIPIATDTTFTAEVGVGDDGTVSLFINGDYTDSCYDANIVSRMGSYVFIEPGNQAASGKDESRIEKGWAFVGATLPSLALSVARRRLTNAARALQNFTSDSPAMAGQDLIARKNTSLTVRIGRALSGNVPSIVFAEAYEIYYTNGSIRTTANFYVASGTTSQILMGAIGGGAGILFGNASDTKLQRVLAGVLATNTNGGIRTGLAATASRPSAATYGEGTQFYDQTLHKPIWSDGTVWRDAAGTAV